MSSRRFLGGALAAGALLAGSAAAGAVARPVRTSVARPAVVSRQISPLPTMGAASDRALTGHLSTGGSILNAGKQLVTGSLPGAAGTLIGGAANAVASSATTALGLAAIGTWVVGGAQSVLNDAAAALGDSTRPQLETTWFSSTYWRMAAIAAVLTLPFLFAAAVQALIRSDLALLAKAAFGYLPLAMLAIAIAAPLATLLLSACDELSSFISHAAGQASAHFLERAGLDTAALSAFDGSPFIAFLVGLFIIAAAFALWVELLLREAAVYVIVLMLPLAFAAFVWPARRVWAIRAAELLVALILSKFAIVAVLSLGGAAVSSAGHSVTSLMAGAVLIMLAAFSPWVLLRLVPLAELASGVGELRGGLRTADLKAGLAAAQAEQGADWLVSAAAGMKRQVEMKTMGDGGPPRQPDAGADPHAAPRDPSGGSVAPAGGPVAPADGPVATAGGAESTAGEPQPADGEAPARETPKWSSQAVLELDGENLGATPVWPHPDAE
ncbi:MAG TPA: hypothetical protein VEF89_09710 [Solirubrobacteraceae bacterium]|nr:hypothetical protein [Solirubrobacteraceae bacterium]